MFSFDMTDEQKMLVDTVHRFAEQQMRKVHREAEESRQTPADLIRKGWEIGLVPASIDAEYGGFGEYSALTSALFMEELGWGDVGMSLHLLTPSLFALPVNLFGSKEQKAEFLPRFCDEEFPKATAALLEPVFQFDPAELLTVAEKDGKEYMIKGTKTYVPLADEAELFLVYANEGGRTQAFIVPADAPGVTVGTQVQMMGAKALKTFMVGFDNVRVSKDNRLGGLRGIRLNRLLTVMRISMGGVGRGSGPGRLRICPQICQGAHGLWRTHRPPPEHRLHAGQHAHRDRRRPADGVGSGLQAGRRRRRHQGRGPGQALRPEHGHGDHGQRGAGPGRPRLHPGISGGTLVPQRPGLRHLGRVGHGIDRDRRRYFGRVAVAGFCLSLILLGDWEIKRLGDCRPLLIV